MFLVDTGAVASFLTDKFKKAKHFRDHEIPEGFRAANGLALELCGSLTMRLKIASEYMRHTFLVAAVGLNMLGFDFLSAHKLVLLHDLVRLELYVPQPEPTLPQNLLDLGARVYKENCAQCHGSTGAGDGTAVSELRIAPSNFRTGRPTLGETLRVLRNGIDGTQMAPWGADTNGRLSEAELSAVAYYVRSLLVVQSPD